MEDEESSSVKADLSPRTRESHYSPAPRWRHCRISIVAVALRGMSGLVLAVQSLHQKPRIANSLKSTHVKHVGKNASDAQETDQSAYNVVSRGSCVNMVIHAGDVEGAF